MFRRTRTPGLGILLLAGQLMQVGIQHIPPVTLGVIALNTAVYLRLFRGLPTVRQACISYAYVWYGQGWKRIFLSPFFHLDDLHLYYNMASFLWKGRSLEPRLGTAGMLWLLSVFSVLTSLTLLALDKGFSILLSDPSYIHTCAAGFSGVIFALKVVTTYNQPPGMTNVFLFQVPSRVACWVELVVIQLLVPSASFTGHLAGILVGLLYVKGPLKQIMDSIGSVSDRPYSTRPTYTYNSGRSGHRYEHPRTEHHVSEQTYVDDEDDDAELQAALQESLNEARERQNAEYLSHTNYSNPGVGARHHGGQFSLAPHTNDLNLNNGQDHNLTREDMRQQRLRRFQT